MYPQSIDTKAEIPQRDLRRLSPHADTGVGHHAFGDSSTDIPLKVMKKSMQLNPEISSRISKLRKSWKRLSSVDRARAIASIQRAHVSISQIARKLGRSESGLRYVLKNHMDSRKRLNLASKMIDSVPRV